MKTLTDFINESNIDNYDLDCDDGIEALESISEETYEEYDYEITVLPNIPDLINIINPSLIIGEGKKWVIVNININDDIDDYGDIIPIDDAPGRSLTYDEALNAWNNDKKLRNQLINFFAKF